MVRFGDITDEQLEKKHLPLTEQNERWMRGLLRKRYGMAAYAKFSLPKLKALLGKKRDIIIDGLRSYEEFLYLRRHLNQRLMIVHIYAPKPVRYRRAAKREVRSLTVAELASRDADEVQHLNTPRTVAHADYTIRNTGTLPHLEKQLDALLKQLEQANDLLS